MVKFVAYSYVAKTLAEAIIIKKASRLHREMFEGLCNFKRTDVAWLQNLVHMYALKLMKRRFTIIRQKYFRHA